MKRRRLPKLGPYRPKWSDLWNGSQVAHRPDGRWYKITATPEGIWHCYLSEEAGDDWSPQWTWTFIRDLSFVRAREWPHYHWAEESGNMVEHREGQRW